MSGCARVFTVIAAALCARADDVAPTPEAINHAIDAGVAWLRSAPKEDGSWGPCGGGVAYGGQPDGHEYRLGPTAFSIFTLAVCGVPRDDAVIVRGIKWLEKATSGYEHTSYESAAVILMLAALNGTDDPKSRLGRSVSSSRPPKGSRFRHDDWRWMDDRVRHLVGCAFQTGGFGYGGFEPSRPDVSATQFACIALRAASLEGYPVEKIGRDIWASTAEFLRGLQGSSGGFPYERSMAPSRGMTAAALSTLMICKEQMALLRDKEPPWMAGAIESGMSYLGANFDVMSNPSPHFRGRDKYHYCYLYALERTGVLSGRNEFGGKGWYARGARFLLDEQYASDGCWRDRSCMDPEDVLGTCFALLFLKKATIPAITR